MEIKVGKVAGAPIIITENLLLFVAVMCGFSAYRAGLSSALFTLGAMFAIAICVLLHEIGHVLAGRRFGIRTVDIRLNFFGGIAGPNPSDWKLLMDRPKAAIVIWACGPLVNIAIGGLLTFAMYLLASYSAIYQYLEWTRSFNIIMAVFNLLPFYPLDGGGILYSILRMKTSKAKAIGIASKVGMIGAVLLFVCAFPLRSIMLGIIAVMIYIAARMAPTSPLFSPTPFYGLTVLEGALKHQDRRS